MKKNLKNLKNSLSTYIQPSSCCSTALPRHAQPTRSVKDTKHPTLNASSTKIILQRLRQARSWLGDFRGIP